MEKLVEKPVTQALTGIEQALCLLNEALILLRSSGLVLHEEVSVEQIDRIHERIEAAHTEIRLLDRQHQHVELVHGGEKLVMKSILLSPQAADMLAHRRKLDAELAGLEFAEQVMFPKDGDFSGKVFNRRFHTESVAREGE